MKAVTVNYEEMARLFESCNVDAGSFTHADHIGVAYDMLRRYDFLDASVRYSTGIRAIAAAAGAEQKFNTTITLAFLSLIAERMETTDHESYEEFVEKNSDLYAGNVLAKWYSSERVQSDLARSVFLMPDSYAASLTA